MSPVRIGGDVAPPARTFVSVAAYRDPQLIPTLIDCLARARHPERLRFGICWQHADDEQLPVWMDGPQFRVRAVDWRHSQGACWARSAVMSLYDGEEAYLQIDSHHRFARDWDVKLARQLAAAGPGPALLTTYAAAYTPGVTDPAPWVTRIDFDHFNPDGVILGRPGVIVDPPSPPAPVPARFLSAHLLYAPGRFVQDVPYDPELYFIGEEVTLAVRAFSHGYDLFHPGEHIAWHEYTRAGRVKHWDDHIHQRGATVAWHERDATSRAKVIRLLTAPWVGRFGLGPKRTLADYEAYARVSFAARRDLDAPQPPPDPVVPSRRRLSSIQPIQPIRSIPPVAPAPARGADRPSIFVAVAAYRDPDLWPTLADCQARADHPERLRFGVAWQHAPHDAEAPGGEDGRVRVLAIDWRQSRGPGWARAQAMRLYDGEDWYLQLDSHHRFAPGWDTTLLRQMALTGSRRAVLSGPAPAFTARAPLVAAPPCRLDVDGFDPDGVPITCIRVMAPGAGPRPARARSVCGHLLLAPGSFVTDVPADPELYLSGAEITTAVRAFSHGYDLFAPGEVAVWHDYSHAGRPLHWEDHAAGGGVARPWQERHRLGVLRFRRVLFRARSGAGLGCERTLADYEAYAGISFRDRSVADHTRRHLPPPNPPSDAPARSPVAFDGSPGRRERVAETV